jgi:selenocysteine-specific elongation factor
VIRRYSPITTLGGGEIIDSHPAKHKRYKEDVLEDLTTLEQASIPQSIEFFIKKAGVKGMDLKAILGRTNLEPTLISQTLEVLNHDNKILILDKANHRAIHKSIYNELQKNIIDILEEFHKKSPLKGGMSKEELKARLSSDLDSRFYSRLLEDLKKNGSIVVKQETCALAGHQVSLSLEDQRIYDQILETYKYSGIQPPNQGDVLERLKKQRNKGEKLIKLLLDEGKLVRLKGDLLFHIEALKSITQQVQEFLRNGKQMDIGDFKEMTGLSRKFAVALLEYLDAEGITIRVGDKRVLRRKVT